MANEQKQNATWFVREKRDKKFGRVIDDENFWSVSGKWSNQINGSKFNNDTTDTH